MAVVFQPTPRQEEFYEAVFSGAYRELLFGGAVGGGKSYGAIGLLLILCRMFPGSRWALVRKDLPTLRRNTLPTWEKVVGPTGFFGPVHKTEWKATANNGSEVLFFTESLSEDPDLDRWKGLEVNGFVFEEVNECQEKTWNKAIERAGRWKVKGPMPPPLLVGTCNPTNKWVKRHWYDPWRNGALKAPLYYLPSKVTDNPHLEPEYLENLKRLPAKEYDRFVNGNWDLADVPNQLIKLEWVEAAFARAEALPRDHLGRLVLPKGVGGPGALAIDVARFGDDETVIARRTGRYLHELRAWQGVDTMTTADAAKVMIHDHKIDARAVLVDSIGVGAGVVDALHKAKLNVSEFIAGARPSDAEAHKGDGATQFFRFKNLRAEAWWNLRECLRPDGGRGLAYFDPALRSNTKLIEDLTVMWYEVDGERLISIPSKDDIKAEIGRSTDYGDAVMMLYHEPPVKKFWAGITTR